MKYPRLVALLRSAKWAALPETVHAVHSSLAAHIRGETKVDMPYIIPGLVPREAAGVSVVPVQGIIGKNLSSLETQCGGCDVNAIQSDIEAALEDDGCSTILLDIDSPGGVVTGVPELAAFIRSAGAEKPIYAFSSGQMCSAAYWIGAATQGIFCTQTADVGSIGVYVALVDESEAWAQAGYKLELMKAGDFKAMGHPGKPLTNDERALIQSGVDKVYAMFTADVQRGRGGDVPASVMQGQTFMGQDAVDAGLVDDLTPDIETLIEQLSG